MQLYKRKKALQVYGQVTEQNFAEMQNVCNLLRKYGNNGFDLIVKSNPNGGGPTGVWGDYLVNNEDSEWRLYKEAFLHDYEPQSVSESSSTANTEEGWEKVAKDLEVIIRKKNEECAKMYDEIQNLKSASKEQQIGVAEKFHYWKKENFSENITGDLFYRRGTLAPGETIWLTFSQLYELFLTDTKTT